MGPGRAWAVAALVGLASGCADRAVAPPAVPPGLIALARPEFVPAVFAAEDEVATATFGFDGAPGFLRLTLESEPAAEGSGERERGLIRDALFTASGSGRVVVTFRRPEAPDRPIRATVRCLAGPEESTVEFAAELWSGRPGAIVTVESPLGEAGKRVEAGVEEVLARYVARNTPREVRLAIRATFGADPPPPRVKAGGKPPR